MGSVGNKRGICKGRLDQSQYLSNFEDLHPPLDNHEARVEAERCYFCYDAPCVDACPTEIDIPLFIRQISTGNVTGSAKTIFSQNILGGMCARVCPTETLCEQVCVREEAEKKPVKIGRLQRFATDYAMAENHQFFDRAKATGKKIAVIGAGPAGLACAHRLAIYGHQVTIFDARSKPGGLNEYGIAAYKTVDDFAAREVAYITAIGGIDIQNGKTLGKDFSLEQLTQDHDGVFISIGLGVAGELGIAGEDSAGVEDAISFIERLRQSADFSEVGIGRRVVVIGGGMTAIDAAIQARHLGAEEVTICYRRGRDQMAASVFEQELATANGVIIRHWLQPVAIENDNGNISGVTFEYTTNDDGKLVSTGERITLEADQLFKAIGQNLDRDVVEACGLELDSNRIRINEEGLTSNPKVWAGGDCAKGGEDLTVSAVAMGRDGAESIHLKLTTLTDGAG